MKKVTQPPKNQERKVFVMANKKSGNGGKNPYVGNSGKPVIATGINKETNSLTILKPSGKGRKV